MKFDQFSSASELGPILIAVNAKLCTIWVRVNKKCCPNWVPGRTQLCVRIRSAYKYNYLS